MARGWESKSVEAQQAEATAVPDPARTLLTPEQAAALRQKEGLLLSRRHVLEQIQASQNPRHRKMLEDALAELEARLARMA